MSRCGSCTVNERQRFYICCDGNHGIEEFADVLLCAAITGLSYENIADPIKEKAFRRIARLEEEQADV